MKVCFSYEWIKSVLPSDEHRDGDGEGDELGIIALGRIIVVAVKMKSTRTIWYHTTISMYVMLQYHFVLQVYMCTVEDIHAMLWMWLGLL